MRITDKDLEQCVTIINKRLRTDAYQLDQAYGGNKLIKREKSGGYRDQLSTGYVTKKELYLAMSGFIDGIDAEFEAQNV